MRSIAFITLALGATACKPSRQINVQNFYYWKTTYQLSAFEKKYLAKSGTKKIYLRCFDVTPEQGAAQPSNVLLWKDSALARIEYVPTVFIQNEVYTQLQSTIKCDSLASHIFQLCTQVLAAQKLQLKEIQLDCDWTASTKQAYFETITALKKKNIKVSSTLRLYQYKYRQQAGVPPADAVSLMCYNMGNLKQASASNSILNMQDLESYTKGQPAYPLPLSIALPIYSWNLVYKGNEFDCIVYNNIYADTNHWRCVDSMHYQCKQDYFHEGMQRFFFKNNYIRVEKINKQTVLQAQDFLQKNIKNTLHEKIYFHCDSAAIQQCLQ